MEAIITTKLGHFIFVVFISTIALIIKHYLAWPSWIIVIGMAITFSVFDIATTILQKKIERKKEARRRKQAADYLNSK